MSGVRWGVSGVRWGASGVRWGASGVRWGASGVRWGAWCEGVEGGRVHGVSCITRYFLLKLASLLNLCA